MTTGRAAVAAVPEHSDVVVLGAGPAGLATAWYAARRGLSVVVVDHAERVGGLAGSVTIGGQSVDLGSHRLHPSIRPDILRDLHELPGLDLRWRERHGRIRLHGRWLAFPLQPVDLVRHARPSFAARVLADGATTPLRRRSARRHEHSGRAVADSFAEQVRIGLGATIADSFYGPFARKLWGIGADELSPELFRRRVSATSVATIVRKALRSRAPAGFWYPERGFGTLGTSLADDIVRRGGVVALATSVDSIAPTTDGVAVHLNDGRTIAARTLASTIPSGGLLPMVGAPADVIAASRRLSVRDALLVYLALPRPQFSPFDAHYLPEATTMVSRLSEPKNYRSGATDPPDRTVLCAEVPATVGDARWTADDAELVGRVRHELREHGLSTPEPIAAHVERRTHVYPVYHRGFEEHQQIVAGHLDRIPNVAVLGRQALFAHDNTHHSLLMGNELVGALDEAGRIDRDRWARARRAFADHVVED